MEKKPEQGCSAGLKRGGPISSGAENDAPRTSEKRHRATNATEFIIDVEIHRSSACRASGALVEVERGLARGLGIRRVGACQPASAYSE